MPVPPRTSPEHGTALLTVLFLVVVLGLGASLAGQTLQAYVQREREAELLWRGQQYSRAIASYHRAIGGGGQAYPSSFDDLLRDPRTPGVVRHLRRPYVDPMTGQPWEIVKDPANRIIGVRSTSTLRPFRQDGFPKELEKLRGKNSYLEWEFVYTPAKKTAGQPAAAGPATGHGAPVTDED